MTTEITIHRCIGLRIKRYYPRINNAITIEVLTEDRVSDVPLLLFGLPLAVTDELMGTSLRDDETTISNDKPTDFEDDELERQLNEELEGIGVVILGPGSGAAA